MAGSVRLKGRCVGVVLDHIFPMTAMILQFRSVQLQLSYYCGGLGEDIHDE